MVSAQNYVRHCNFVPRFWSLFHDKYSLLILRLPTHFLSFSHFHLQCQYSLSSVTSRENTITLSFQLTAVNRHKNVCAVQTFSDLLHLFGEIFFNFKNNRNFVKPPKERNKQQGRRHVPPNILFTNPSARAGYDTRPIFKRSLTGLNSEFSFS